MDPAAILAWTRGIERLGIVALFGVSLVLGWDLFRRGVVTAQQADLKAHGWSIKLQRVGPGIFFSLFATVAFVSAIAHPLQITSGTRTQQEMKSPGNDTSTVTNANQSISEAASPTRSTDRDVITAINTFHLLLLPVASKGLDASSAGAVAKADRTLDSYKRSMMFQQFGQMSIQFYSVRDQVSLDPSILARQSPSFQAKFPEIEGADKDTFLRTR